jgi:hypothetical protein
MATLNVKEVILANVNKSNKEIAEMLNISTPKVSCTRNWLVRKGLVEGTTKSAPKSRSERTNDILSIYGGLTNTYRNHDGENKEVARVKMTNYVVDSGVVGDLPTLPNTDWIIEQKIAKQLPDMRFIGAEIDRTTYNQMRRNLKNTNLNATTHFGKIGELIYGKTENTYAHLILDYCGHLSTFSKEIEYVINNDILKLFGIMAITFGKPLRGLDSQTAKIKGLAPINNGDERCVSDRGIENYFAKITGWNYEVKEIFYYSDKKESGKGYPMTLVIIQRIK